MSGCSGNQAVAVSMRELSLGLVRPSEIRRVWLKEVSVGLLNGLALGLLIAAVAWVSQGNPFLGLVVGSPMMLNTVLAVSIGGALCRRTPRLPGQHLGGLAVERQGTGQGDALRSAPASRGRNSDGDT